jgi:DNA-binding XRE family transcriptional regulator
MVLHWLLLSRVLESILIPYAGFLQDIEKQVGKRIQALRRRKGLTQDEFANLAGLNRTHVYRLETGQQSITLRTMKIIADALDVRVKGFG